MQNHNHDKLTFIKHSRFAYTDIYFSYFKTSIVAELYYKKVYI